MDRAATTGSVVKGQSPDEAFAALSNPTRLAILRALWEGPEETMSFSELRERVAVTDSGNFNYHVRQLVGGFVERTEGGYRLRGPGRRVVRAVVAGAIEDAPEFDPVEIDEECPFCEGTVELLYQDGHLVARCLACEGIGDQKDDLPSGTYLRFEFPAAGLRGRFPAETLLAAYTFYDFRALPMMANVCPECASTVSVSPEICDAHDATDGKTCGDCGRLYQSLLEYVCVHCRYSRTVPMRCRLFADPAAISFFYRPDDEYSTLSDWMTEFMSSEYVTERVISMEPLRVRMTARVADDELRVTLNEHANIVSVERS